MRGWFGSLIQPESQVMNVTGLALPNNSNTVHPLRVARPAKICLWQFKGTNQSCLLGRRFDFPMLLAMAVLVSSAFAGPAPDKSTTERFEQLEHRFNGRVGIAAIEV